MAEYIEREAAIARLENLFQLQASTARAIIEAIPAADVAPVKHGRYIGEYDGYADGCPVFDMWYCSECGCYFEEWDEMPTYNYCPHCGAKMDKGETE